jgi:hypothetical protein
MSLGAITVRLSWTLIHGCHFLSFYETIGFENQLVVCLRASQLFLDFLYNGFHGDTDDLLRSYICPIYDIWVQKLCGGY